MFPAYSPQAKGKIERLWQTLQSRLPVIFAQNNISSLESANNFLLSYIPDFNKQFSVEPLDAFSAFVPVSDDFDLDRLLSFTFERNLSAASTVSLHGSLFKIEQHRFPAKTHVTLLLSQKHGLRALINGEFYPILRKVRRNHARFSQCPSTLSLIPLKNHPRKGGIEDITEGLNLSESFL